MSSSTKAIEIIEEQLIATSLNIGSVSKKNNHYTHSLTLRLLKLDKPLDQLTVAEFIKQINLATESYNSVFGAEL